MYPNISSRFQAQAIIFDLVAYSIGEIGRGREVFVPSVFVFHHSAVFSRTIRLLEQLVC
jgi:hypothetical protein